MQAFQLGRVRATVSAMAYGTLVDLGALPVGITQADAYSVNDSRQVVGTWSGQGDSFGARSSAFVWGAVAGYRTVADGNPFATAYAVNNRGHAVGFSGQAQTEDNVDQPQDAFALDAATGLPLPGWRSPGTVSAALGINDGDDVVGWRQLQSGATQAFIWNAASGFTPLVNGQRSSTAIAVNGARRVAGQSLAANGNNHAYVWTPVLDPSGKVRGWTAHDIDPRPDVISESYAINGRGQVAGAGYPEGGSGEESHAFLWTPNASTGGIGRLEVLPFLPGTVESEANDVNDDGVVVGYCANGPDSGHAVLWQGHSAAVDLNQFVAGSGWTLLSANSINNHGDIVGYGMHSGQYRAFMLVPVATRHSPYEDLRRQIFAQLVYILYGVRLGEGGAVFTPPNRPVPVPPGGDGPFDVQRLAGNLRDALSWIATDPKKVAVPRAALEQARKDIDQIIG